MGHAPKVGAMATDMLGAVVDAFRVTFGATGAPTLSDKGKTGLVASVTRNSAGLYTIQLNPNYYASVIAVIPKLSAVGQTGAVQDVRYIEGSYSATNGNFQVAVVADEDAPAAADPTNGSAMDVIVVFQRYSNL